MKIPIELTEDSRNLLANHFKENTDLHRILAHANRDEVAGVAVYGFECEPAQAEALLDNGTRPLPSCGKRY